VISVDEVTSELVVSAIAAVGRQIATQIQTGGRRTRTAVEVAAFFNTYALLDKALPSTPGDSDQEALIAKLRSHEVQALVQELLAVRLSDGPELVAQEIHQRFKDICSSGYAEQIFEEVDRQIENLVVQISAVQPEILNQIREEAHYTRINATLEAINRHLDAMNGQLDPTAERAFWERYRRHVMEHHGMIEPPDFDRRRRVPIEDLYVAPQIFEQSAVKTTDRERRKVDIYDTTEIDRTVLLGNPGGGKTTASNVLLHWHAQESELGTPFLVTLRDFGASDPPQWSVVEYLDHRLRTFYQCAAPEGAINRLLLAGGAFIVFDGLDELIDTSRRAEMSAIIEQFSIEYPLTKILVTSRIVGYEEARLDIRLFTILTIDGFNNELVSQYVHKWFSQEPDTSPEVASQMAQGLIQESHDIHDIISNPLMLALICILYRGERSIPRSRSDVYEKCADLLFRKWDARRKIYVELRARHLIEPAIRYLAYWMLTRQDIRTAVSRKQLVIETATYFRSRGFDENNDPAAAAEEFVDFCRGRAWVFSEVGSTGEGEQLYTFTHRTFMEYFAAYYLASVNELPERLARALAPKVAKREWDMVGQLAVQIKDRNVERGAERIFETLIGDPRKRSLRNRLNVLEFLARCMDAVQPRPSIARRLMAEIIDAVLAFRRSAGSASFSDSGISTMIRNSHDSSSGVAEALNAAISRLVADSDLAEVAIGLELGCCMTVVAGMESGFDRHVHVPDFWIDFSQENITRYREQIVETARVDDTMLWLAYRNGFLTSDEIVSICTPDNIQRLYNIYWYRISGIGFSSGILIEMAHVATGTAEDGRLLSALGRYLISLDDIPLISSIDLDALSDWLFSPYPRRDASDPLKNFDISTSSGTTYLGLLYSVALSAEAAQLSPVEEPRKHFRFTTPEGQALANAVNARLGRLPEFATYVTSRFGVSAENSLPPLAIGERYADFFRKWAAGEISIASSSSAQLRQLQDAVIGGRGGQSSPTARLCCGQRSSRAGQHSSGDRDALLGSSHRRRGSDHRPRVLVIRFRQAID
jgi:hypothetical protein